MAESKVESDVCENIERNVSDRENKEEKAASPCEEQWQSSRETIRDRNRYMFRNTLMSDVNFLVDTDEEMQEKCESKPQRSIPAHKYVLAIGSPVFYAMFYGDLAEVDSTVTIPDTTYDCFVEFLRFLYYDEVELCLDTVIGVRYLAKKYIVPALEKKCAAFVEDAVDASNVFQLLSLARSYKDDFVERVCWDFLDSETSDSLKSPSFCQVDMEVVRELLARDTLHAKEIDLFLAVQNWATATSESDGKESLKENIADIINLVRYPLMSQREFAEHVVKSKLLRHEDVINMFLKFNDTLEDETVLPFSQVPRRGYYRCPLYQEVFRAWDINRIWDVEASQIPNVLTFSCNSNILLCGVGLYGNDNNDDSYSFSVNVEDEDEQVLLSSKGSFSCHAQCFAYDVIFNKPVRVLKNVWYTIRATVDGPRGVCGGQTAASRTLDLDIDEITCGPVKFLFKDLRPENVYSHFSGLLYFLH